MRARRTARLTWGDHGALALQFSYDPLMVAGLKASIPSSDRRWDAATRCWQVTPAYLQAIIDLARRHLGVELQPPLGTAPRPALETRLLEVRYIGITKERGDGQQRTAYGHCNGAWSVILPEPVLLRWFGVDMGDADDGPTQPAPTASLYGVLGIQRTATGDDVRKAYRRLAMQWHPDRCKEPDAHDMFIRIQHAYEVLRDDGLRARYDAGLLLQAAADEQTKREAAMRGQLRAVAAAVTIGYRSPLRCGLIMAEGIEQLGRFVVSNIIAWEDIPGPSGTVLSTSWPAGAQMYVEDWV